MKKRFGSSRRNFLGTVGKGALGGIAGAMALGSRSAAARTEANHRIRLALIGCGAMGTRHLEALANQADAEVVAVCDAYIARYQAAARKVAGKTGNTPDGYQDYRRVLDRDDIDAVYIAAPGHWHALMTIHACQAWKDVYVEPPVATSVLEGRAMVNAARRYGRVVQAGTQQRSQGPVRDAVAVVTGGKLGAVALAGAWVGTNGGSGVRETPGRVPEGLDWDLWLGPAPWAPYSPQRFGGFRAWRDYAHGELTNTGVHLLDMVQWGIGEDRPVSVQAVGDGENVDALFEYKGCTVAWQQRHGNAYPTKAYGVRFQGTGGRVTMDAGHFVAEPASLGIPGTRQAGDRGAGLCDHHNDFLECIRTRNRPNADIEIAHRSTTTCLLAAIAMHCGRKLCWDGAAERFVDDVQANRRLLRAYRAPWHL